MCSATPQTHALGAGLFLGAEQVRRCVLRGAGPAGGQDQPGEIFALDLAARRGAIGEAGADHLPPPQVIGELTGEVPALALDAEQMDDASAQVEGPGVDHLRDAAQLPDGGLKDTAENIKRTKGFTVNLISEPFIENANITSIDSPPEVGEWGMSGLTKAPSVSTMPCPEILVGSL